ncbi:MAG: prepilin peptidase [Deltaproteobacteria bacterium]|nr:prepilin peptidase [Myxococcales bacterium]MDP3214705.1 prepilin peptidase [Deltaproteobacteria bacterium]
MIAADLPAWFFRVFAFLWGAVWGSFATVVVHRWPRHSLVRPGSHCPHCQKPVRPYDNVPILAWLWLRGRCRDCKAPISPRYALIEAMYAVCALALVELLLRAQVDLALPVFLALFFVRFAFAWGLLTASFIDLKKLLLPDFITLGGTVLGVVANVLLPGIGWRASLLGVALGAGIPYAFYFVWDRFLKRDGMGLGDVKLMAMVGALLGPQAVVFALFAGSMQGIAASLLARATGWKLAPDIDPDDLEDDDAGSWWESAMAFTARVTGWKRAPRAVEELEDEPDEPEAAADGPEPLMRMMIPFGPFLALGAIEYMLGGERLMQSYLSLLRGQ